MNENQIYLNKNECVNNIDQCLLLNNNKDKCLARSECGWCTDNNKNGICVSGTPIGPFNLEYNCKPDTGEVKNTFTMGKVNPFILPTINTNTNIFYENTI